MLNRRYFDRDGKELTQEEFNKKLVDPDYKKIGYYEVLANGERVKVSTVWLGMNHNYSPAGEPVIFETMVFGGRNNGLCRRYSTELEALIGHNEVVDIVQDTLYM